MRKSPAARTAASLTLGLLAVFMLVGTVFAWPNILEGRPGNLQPGGELGYYIWHQEGRPVRPGPGPGMMLVVTGPQNEEGHVFEGRIETDGRFASVDLIAPDRPDDVALESDQVLRFHFRNHGRIDGLNFEVVEGTHLVYRLAINGERATTDQIFMGQGSIHPVELPLVLYR